MSDIFGEDSSSIARDILIHDYLHIFAVSCLFYDHAITAGQEIDYLWKRPKSRSSFWFFVTRYLALFGNISVTVLGFTNLSVQVGHFVLYLSSRRLTKNTYAGQRCRRYALFRQLLLIANQVVVCILLTLRIYALYACSMRILAYMLASGAVLVGVSLWALFGQKSAPSETMGGCHVGLSTGTAIRLAGAWEALFVYDSIIFGLTIAKTWNARRDHAITGISIPLITLLLRDGAIYFAVMALCNFANILTFYFAGPFLKGGLSTFASSISVTMMSRLMLNLHRTADMGIYSTDATTTDDHYTSPYLYGTLDIVNPTSVSSDTESRPERQRSISRKASRRQS